MGDADRNFKIFIVSEAQGTGIQQTSADLDALKAKAESTATALKAANGGAGSSTAAELEGSSVAANAASVAVGAVGAGLLIAAAAGQRLYQAIQDSAEESRKLTAEVNEQATKITELSIKWEELARNASSAADVMNIGKTILPGLEAAQAKLEQLSQTQLTMSQSATDMLQQFLQLSNFHLPTEGSHESNLDEQVARAKQLQQELLDATNASIAAANKSAEAWERVKLEPINQAVDEYTAKVNGLKDAIAKVGPITSPADLKELNRLNNELVITEKHLGELQSIKEKAAAATEKAAQKVADAAAKQAQEEQRANEKAQKAADDLKKRHDETLTDLDEEIAINKAKAAGDNDLVEKLTKQRDIRKEILKLQKDGFSEEEATAKAIELVNSKLQDRAAEAAPGNSDRSRHLNLSGNVIDPKNTGRLGLENVRTESEFQKDFSDSSRSGDFKNLFGQQLAGALPGQGGAGSPGAGAGDAAASTIQAAGAQIQASNQQVVSAAQKAAASVQEGDAKISAALDNMASSVQEGLQSVGDELSNLSDSLAGQFEEIRAEIEAVRAEITAGD